MAKGHVARADREGLSAEGVVVYEVCGPLTAAQLAAMHEGMGHEDVDRAWLEAFGQCVDDQPHPLGVGLSVLVGLRVHEILGPHDAPLRDERQHG